MKFNFLEDGNGNQSIGRLIFAIGSLWNMFICGWMVLKLGKVLEIVGVYTGIQTVLSAYILIHKKEETDEEKK
jgi:hypothetical protein